ncbi:MAG: succinate dehydrogenase [Gemmatimonadota bacterium]
MPHAVTQLQPRRGFAQTSRTDPWWVTPLAVFLGLSAFGAYATWAAFQNANYTYGNYLSPFYSPEIWGSSPHALLGPKPAWWPGFLPFSPALIILIFPLGFRLTCYYYRGAYYKAFWADPPSCAVGEPRKSYLGERHFPLILQNIHRYFLYFALLFLLFLAHDAWMAMWFEAPSGGSQFGIGVGTLVLTLNVVFLGSYTLGCHSLRHLVGGRLNRFSDRPAQFQAWRCVTCLNARHMRFAWLSLVWVGFSDLYVRLCAMGIWTDWRLF